MRIAGLFCKLIRCIYKSVKFIVRILMYLLGIRYTKPAAGHEGEWYEMECCRMLKKRKYRKIKTTKVTGDQGADILAWRHGKSYAIQCKYYSSNVGNKAVQEAHAARGYYECDCAIVISSSGFTKSAKDLAEKLDIRLIEHFNPAKGLVSNSANSIWYRVQGFIMIGLLVWLYAVHTEFSIFFAVSLLLSAICNIFGMHFMAAVISGYTAILYIIEDIHCDIAIKIIVMAMLLSIMKIIRIYRKKIYRLKGCR